MAFAITPVAAKDGTGATITGGVEFIDISGTGVGPFIITKTTLDPAGANAQFVLANNAAKSDLSSVAGTTTDTNNGTVSAGTQRVTIASNSTGQVALAAGSNVIGHVIADTGSTTAVTGTVATAGPTASGSALSANPITEGGLAKTALPTAVADAQVVNAMHDKFGRQVNLPITIRDLAATQTTTISASTGETTIVTQIASTFNDLIALIVINTSASTTTRIDFRDTTGGTIIFALQSIGGSGPVGFVFPVPLPQTTVNTNWTAQCSASTTDVRILAFYAKNK